MDKYTTTSLSDGTRHSCNSSYIASLGYEFAIENHRFLLELQSGVTETARGGDLSFRSRFRYDWYALEYTESNMFETDGSRYEGTRGYEDEAHWDIDMGLAYELHYRRTGRSEFAYDFTSYSEFGDYSIKYWDRVVKDFEWQGHLAAPFWYRRQLHSLYAMLSDNFGPVSLEAGVRGEHTNNKMHFDEPYTSRAHPGLSCKRR